MASNTLSVGNVEIRALHDGEVDFAFPLTELFPGTTVEAWAPYRRRYPWAFSGPDIWRAHWGGYLLRSEGRNVLVNTGIGSSATNPGMVNNLNNGVDGRLIDEIRAAGVPPEEIDLVFFTHLHPDHVGYNLSQRGQSATAMFPRARYLVHQADWDAFSSAEVQALFPFGFWEETLAPLLNLGVLDLLSGDHALTSELTAIHTPGHTPGHMSLRISSAGESAVVLGDVAIHPAQITEADWSFAFELDGPRANQTRREFFERLATDGTTVAACHFSSPGFGRIVRLEGRRYWQGLDV